MIDKPVNIPSIGSRLFNIYEGEREEKIDIKEKLGQVYIYFLSQAIGQRVVLKKAQKSDIKTSQLAFRILFGLAALATLPFTCIGIILVALSKTQKKAHELALNSLQVNNPVKDNKPPQNEKIEKPVMAPVKDVKQNAKSDKAIPIENKKVKDPNPQEKLQNPPKNGKAKIRLIFKKPEPEKQDQSIQLPNQNIEPKENKNPIDSEKKSDAAQAKPVANTAPLTSILDKIGNLLSDTISKIEELEGKAKVEFKTLYATGALAKMNLEQSLNYQEKLVLLQEKHVKLLNDFNENVKKQVASNLNPDREIIDKHKNPSFNQFYFELKEELDLVMNKSYFIFIQDEINNVSSHMARIQQEDLQEFDMDDFPEDFDDIDENPENINEEEDLAPAKKNTKEEKAEVKATTPSPQPQKLVYPSREDAEAVKVFIENNPQEHSLELLKHCLNHQETINKIRSKGKCNYADSIVKLIDELEKKQIKIFPLYKYDENDALGLAIRFDRTDDKKIIKRLITYINNLPLNKENSNPKYNWEDYKKLARAQKTEKKLEDLLGK